MQTHGLSKLSKEVVLLMAISIVGFGLFQGARLLDVGSGPYSNAPFAVAGIAAGGVAYAAVAIVAWTGRLEKTRGLCIAGIACALAWLLASGGSGPVWACVAQILGGVGWALVNLCWMQLFSLVIPRYAVILIACGYLVDSLLVPACTAWVPDLRRECFYVALAGSWVALAVCLAGSPRLYRAMQDQTMQESAPNSQTSSTQGLRGRMARALVGTAVFSAMCGLVVQVDLFRGVQYAQAPATSLVCAAVALAMVVALAALRPRGVDVDAIYPLSVAAFASVLLFRAFLPQQANFAGSLMVALLITFFSLLWMGFVSEAHARKLPALFVLGLPVAVAQLSIAAGRSLGYLPAGTFVGSSDAQLVAFVLWGLLLSLCLLYGAVLLGRRSPRGQGGALCPGTDLPPGRAEAADPARRNAARHPAVPACAFAHALAPRRPRPAARALWPLGQGGPDRGRVLLGPQRPLPRRPGHDLGAHGQDLPAPRLRQARRPLAPGAARPHGRAAKRGLLRRLLHRRFRSREAPAILARSSSRVGTDNAAEHHGV